MVKDGKIMTKTIELGRDFNGKLSSQPVAKTGTNKGFRKPEKGGNWLYAGGFDEHSRLTEKAVHGTWIQAVQKLGHKVGRWDFDGVTSFYVFEPKVKITTKLGEICKVAKDYIADVSEYGESFCTAVGHDPVNCIECKLKELTRMTEEFGGYKKEQEMLQPCPECGAETQGTWIRIDKDDIWHVGCTKCSWQPR